MTRNNNKNSNQKNKEQNLSIINSDAAGIDIGSREHYVCVPPDRGKKTLGNLRFLQAT